MKETSLGDICEFKYGKSLPARLRVPGPFAVYGSNGRVGSHTESITDGPTIVVGRKGSVGQLHYSCQCCWPIDTAYYIDRTCSDADLRWLYHALKSLRLDELNKATGVPGVNRNDAYERRLILPTREAQSRIAERLDLAEGTRRKWEQAITIAERFLRSVFLEMFGDPVRNRKGWRTATMAELGEVQGGVQVSPRRKGYPIQRPYLRVANVFRDRLDVAEIKVIGLTEKEHDRVRLTRGDVLIVEGHGNPGEIGRAAVWDGSIEDCVHQNHLIRFRPDSMVLGEYVSRMLNTCGGRRQLVTAGRTTSGLNTISTAKVKGVVVPVPPIDLQRTFLGIVRRHAGLLTHLEAGRSETDKLCASACQRALRGEL